MNVTDKVIFHVSDVDLDGVVCRLVAEVLLSPYCKKYIPFNTAERSMESFDFKIAQDSDIIIFTDIVPTKDLYEKLIEMQKEVYIYDHHLTGRQDLGELPNYTFDKSRCGSKIFFEELTDKRRNRTLDQLVELTNVYDLWKTDSPLWEKAKDLSNVLYSYVNWKLINIQNDTERYEDFLFMQHKKIQENKSFVFTSYEQLGALKARDKEENAYKKAKKNIQFRIDCAGNAYAYVEMPAKLSLVCHRLLNEFRGQIKYIAAHSTFKKGDTKVSLRCKDDVNIDLSKIAARWGGGGHASASAFELQQDIFQQFQEGKIHLI